VFLEVIDDRSSALDVVPRNAHANVDLALARQADTEAGISLPSKRLFRNTASIFVAE
jgi:hypothetical protein